MDTQQTQCTLVSVSSTIKENSNGTKFRTCVANINGTDYLAKIWEKSFQNGVTMGGTYTAELQLDGDTVWITVLNGSKANIATPADFAHLFAGITI
jgi:hypothetical protein